MLVLAATLGAVGIAQSATPAGGTLSPNAGAEGKISWTGSATNGTETLASDQGEACFGANKKPDPASGCDFFKLDVSVPSSFWHDHPGVVHINGTGFGVMDLDMYVYRRNADGTRGAFENGDGEIAGMDENVSIEKATGSYYVVMTPYQTAGPQSYSATAEFETRRGPSLAEVNRRAPRGAPNYRASHDRYLAHSEDSVAMDPLNHDHLIAGSKMFEVPKNYLFKDGAYESFDGGRHWKDWGQLPGYCSPASAGYCNPGNANTYRIVSDPVVAFDDEGNAYFNNLDSIGGPSTSGWNQTVHIKRPGKPWTGPIVVHDNRRDEVSKNLFLDDKNWITVDNRTDTGGGPNRPRDGKIGTIYVCWGYDGGSAVPFQQIVIMKSLDGGKTWGGVTPGDNTPFPVSQKTLISGIGCHVAIGPKGEVYVTWYDNQLQALMQAKSTDRGQSFTPAAPIAAITGVDDPFEGEAFRNLSIPASGVDSKGNVFVVVTSRNAEGAGIAEAQELGKKLKEGEIEPDELAELLENEKEAEGGPGPEVESGGDGAGPESGADIVMFKSTNGGASYSGPVRVNQDAKNGDADQFQPWLAITDRDQLNVSFFDRRNDPSNYFIDTYLARSNNGGRTFKDTRASRSVWDASINAPTSPSGKFIGDYQGLAADDEVAIPFWNDTQGANLEKSDKEYSPNQEVWAARVANVPSKGGPRRRCVSRRAAVKKRSIAKVKLGYRSSTVASKLGLPGKRRKGVWRYCVRGGGKFIVVFSKRKRALFIASTARRHHRGPAHPGISLRRLKRIYRHKGLRRVRSDVRRVGPIVYGVRRKRVRYVGIASKALRRSRRLLVRYHKRAGFATSRRTHRRRGG
jgi:hypothetical protein